jgi:hypothetical protein
MGADWRLFVCGLADHVCPPCIAVVGRPERVGVRAQMAVALDLGLSDHDFQGVFPAHGVINKGDPRQTDSRGRLPSLRGDKPVTVWEPELDVERAAGEGLAASGADGKATRCDAAGPAARWNGDVTGK